MEVFVGRQPIFDARLKTYGYELLFRSGRRNEYAAADDSAATAAVIANTFLSIGARNVLGEKRGFINFPRAMLVGEATCLPPREAVVVEILETVTADEEVLAACFRLKRMGYLLALDDFTPTPDLAILAPLADFIKVDFRQTPPADCRLLAKDYGSRGVKMVAEKIETAQELEFARSLGYSYFQGYFFTRPVILSAREVSGSKLNYLRILRELHREELDFESLERRIRLEVSLARKLLVYINSAIFGWSKPIASVRQALIALGEKESRKWISLAAMPHLAGDKPDELSKTAVIRGRMCENLATLVGLGPRAADLFLMGLFSLLDVMIGRPLGELLGEVGIDGDIRRALTGGEEPGGATAPRLRAAFRIACACEAADQAAVGAACAELGLDSQAVSDLYVEALAWAEEALRGAGPDGGKR